MLTAKALESEIYGAETKHLEGNVMGIIKKINLSRFYETRSYVFYFGIGGIALVFIFIISNVVFYPYVKNEDDTPIAVAIVVGRHANANQFTDDYYEKISDYLQQAVYEGYVSLIRLDGDPRVIYSTKFNKADNYNYALKKKLVDKRITDVLNVIKSDVTLPLSQEVNTLLSIKEATRSLNSFPDNIPKYIIILDTGISTKGDLNFKDEGLFEHDSSEIFYKLKSVPGILPNLFGYTVIWIGMGDVAIPQELTETNILKINSIWKDIIIGCGAANYVMLDAPKGTIPNLILESEPIGDEKAFQYVTPIHFDTPTINWDSFEADMPSEEMITFTDLKLGFIPDTAEYLSKEGAEYTLKPYADIIMKSSDLRVLLVGTTSKVQNTNVISVEQLELSKRRANRVRETLIELGVSADAIEIIGLGSNAPWHKNEWVDGRFDMSIARENRAVIMLPLDSDLAKQLLEAN